MAIHKYVDMLQNELNSHQYTYSNYYESSIIRYAKTLELASHYITIDANTKVGEVGPGILLPTLRSQTSCYGGVYGFAEETLANRLNDLGINHSHWDLSLPLPKSIDLKQYDIMFFLEVIEHLLRYPNEVLADIASLVRPGGILVISTVNFVRISNRIRMLLGRTPLINPFIRTPDGRHHIREFCLSELVSYAEMEGLVIDQSEHWQIYNNRLATIGLTLPSLLVPSLKNYLVIVCRTHS